MVYSVQDPWFESEETEPMETEGPYEIWFFYWQLADVL